MMAVQGLFQRVAILLLLSPGYGLRPPDFISDWLFMRAQDPSLSVCNVAHGLGLVPDLVEVLVKAVDGPNKGFIFKAMGNGEKDDDISDTHGGVVYFYNEQFVKVVVPNRHNHFYTGGAIYTGESPFWTGVNSQFSFDAAVQVRCWITRGLPTPCFKSSGIEIKAGIVAGNSSYIELRHGLGVYPDILKVRARLTDGSLLGWHCEAQGSVTGHFSINSPAHAGGFKFGYSTEYVRIWAANARNDFLCATFDGWGTELLYATTGLVEIMAWCDLGLPPVYEHTVQLGPSLTNPQLETTIPYLTNLNTVTVSLMVKVESGPNAEFLFEGVGSAKSNTYNIDTSPCIYGGIIFAYSNSTMRVWQPITEAGGSAVCIPDTYGNGINAMAADEVTVYIKIRQWHILEPAIEYTVLPVICQAFRRVGSDMGYGAMSYHMVLEMTLSDCHNKCSVDTRCVTFSYKNTICTLFDTFDSSDILYEANTELWTNKNLN